MDSYVSLAMVAFAAVAVVGVIVAFVRGIKPKRRPSGFDPRMQQWKNDHERR